MNQQENDFRWHQHNFSDHIRHGTDDTQPEGVEVRRMKIYRDLFFNNVKGFIVEGFPVLADLWGESKVETEVKEFWQEHHCDSPYFLEISREFLTWLIEERTPKDSDFPFLYELAHYEWIELDIAFRHKSQFDKPIDANTLNPDSLLAVSDIAQSLQYQYPVHQIRQGFQPQEPLEIPLFLIVYRDEEDEVQFMEINPMTARLLELIRQGEGAVLESLISCMSELLPEMEEVQVESAVIQVVLELAQRQIVREKVAP